MPLCPITEGLPSQLTDGGQRQSFLRRSAYFAASCAVTVGRAIARPSCVARAPVCGMAGVIGTGGLIPLGTGRGAVPVWGTVRGITVGRTGTPLQGDPITAPILLPFRTVVRCVRPSRTERFGREYLKTPFRFF